MDASVGKQLAFGIIGWTLYFLVIFFICHYVYLRLQGKAPGRSSALVIINGKTITALTAWEERSRKIRRSLIGVGVTLMLLPLILPAILKILYS